MKKQWRIDENNGIGIDEKARRIVITEGDFRSGGTRTVKFEHYLRYNPHPSWLTKTYDEVCRAIRQLDMTGLTDEAVCWANLASE